MRTILEVLALSTTFLSERGVERPRRSTEELLAFVLGIKRMDLYLQHDRPLIETELEKMRALVKKRSTGEPLEYVVGEVEFYHCKIKVTRDVLIPRPETELLVDLIVKELKDKEGVLWDVCAGPGTMGLALKKALPGFSVTLSDSSPEALLLARQNADSNGLEVHFRQGDLLDPFQGEKADVIVCNPPYISKKEYDSLDPSVRDFEPRGALLGGEKGTEFYERLASLLPFYLNPGGKVYFEIGSTQGPSLQAIFKGGKVIQDLAGHDRFFFLEMGSFFP
jgi:release factor glutamine methyltransferase